MSISSAFNGALSGLQAFGKKAELISTNVSNATTPGYGVRSLNLESNSVAAGVVIGRTERIVDPVILSARRDAESQMKDAEIGAAFRTQLLEAIGTPDNPNSLSAAFARFETSLIDAAALPEAPARLNAVAVSAVELTSAFNKAADTISDARSRANLSIADQVNSLNSSLQDLEKLNVGIVTANLRGLDASSMLDQRQNLVDRINAIVPVTEVNRENGAIALFSQGGMILIDGPPAEFAFDLVNSVTPYQSLSAGTLSGLTINGRSVETATDSSPVRGGSLIALFAVRDEMAPEAQQKLDAVARDLIARFQSPALDPTLLPGQAGFFTDGGAAFSVADEIGIANRLRVNSQIDAQTPAELWRIRSGLGAASPGPVGDASLINAMRETLNRAGTVASGAFGPGAMTFSELTSRLVSWSGSQSAAADQRQAFFAASFTQFRDAELSNGVDTDQQLQNLLIVEKAYAANARVLQTIDEMLETLMRLG